MKYPFYMEQTFTSPPADLVLEPREVHIWRASLNPSTAHLQLPYYSLAADELSRAERFYFDRDRWHYVIARAVLRAILSRYLEIAPDQLRFSYGPHGKPALSLEPSQNQINFNVAHSHGLALYAITRGRRIGVDLEYIRHDIASEEIAEHFFSQQEVAMLRALPVAQRQEAFFACWTRKEAYVKARGEGLLLPLNQFDVSVTPGAPALLLSTRDDPLEAARWSLRELSIGPDYQATVAMEGQGCFLYCWQWPE
jgi:4'-phosphopantetheinyl transferase